MAPITIKKPDTLPLPIEVTITNYQMITMKKIEQRKLERGVMEEVQ